MQMEAATIVRCHDMARILFTLTEIHLLSFQMSRPQGDLIWMLGEVLPFDKRMCL